MRASFITFSSQDSAGVVMKLTSRRWVSKEHEMLALFDILILILNIEGLVGVLVALICKMCFSQKMFQLIERIIFERARSFSFCKGHFFLERGNFSRIIKKKTSGLNNFYYASKSTQSNATTVFFLLYLIWQLRWPIKAKFSPVCYFMHMFGDTVL